MIFLRIKKNIELSDDERNQLKRVAKQYGIDLYGIRVVRNKGLTWKGKVGAFSIRYPDTIFICHDEKNPLYLLPTLAHELVHYKQCQGMGKMLFFICKTYANFFQFFGLRVGIEKPAYAIEDTVTKITLGY